MAFTTILIVDDAPVDAIVLKNMLAHAGYQALIARNGVEALEVMEKHPEIALVVSDVSMPEMDGVELLQAIREHEDIATLPLMFVSAAADVGTVKSAVSLGPAGYVLKPVLEPSRVLERIRQALVGQTPVIEEQDVVRARTGLGAHEFRSACQALVKVIESGADDTAASPGSGGGGPGLTDLEMLARTVGAARLCEALSRGAAVAPGAVAREKTAVLHVLKAVGF